MRGGPGEDERQGEEGHEGEGPEVAEEELEREGVVVGHQHAHGRGVDAVPFGGSVDDGGDGVTVSQSSRPSTPDMWAGGTH